MDLPGPIRILDDDVRHVAKQRELAADMAKSAYYITPKHAVKDVERYSDGFYVNELQRRTLASQLPAEMKQYFPPELMDNAAGPSSPTTPGALQGLKPLPAFDAKSLTALEDKERKNAESGVEKEKEKDDAGMMSDVELDVEDEEQDDDYAVHYSESGDDSAGDDEPAAVF